ncbi:transposase [Streptomyces ardesiacus]|uniref:transposase n=1 Tax=Streptomyces ardesiacus TaxID=285564 RepID=UPI003802E965
MILEAVPVTFRPCHSPDGPPRTGRHATTPKPCEGTLFWQQVLTGLRKRGVKDILMLVCDGLSALPDAVATAWPQTIGQRCVVHLIRQSLRYASRQDWQGAARNL